MKLKKEEKDQRGNTYTLKKNINRVLRIYKIKFKIRLKEKLKVKPFKDI